MQSVGGFLLRQRSVSFVLAALVAAGGLFGVSFWLATQADADPVCTKVWTGNIDDEYYMTGGNWDPVGVPTATDFACADVAADIYFDYSGLRRVRGINFEGTLTISRGELRIGTTTNGAEDSYVEEMTVEGGRRGGTSTLVVGDTLTMYGGTLGSSNSVAEALGGRTVVGPFATLYVDFGMPLSGQHTLRVEGETSWFDGDILLCDGSVIENAGYFELPTDGYNVLACGAAPIGLLKNEATGTVVKLFSGFDDTIGTRFENAGKVVVESDTLHLTGDLLNFSGNTLTGGTYELAGALRVAEAASGIATNAATLRFTGPESAILNASGGNALAALTSNNASGRLEVSAGKQLAVSSSLSNTGQVIINGATSRLSLPGASASYTQSGSGSTQLLSATASLGLAGGSSSVNINGGRLSGLGTVQAATVKNNGGVVAPGTSPGVLNVQGDFQQGPGGTLEVEINGTAVGTGHDRLAVTGVATVGGTLQLLTGFVPSETDEFTFLTAASRFGTFATVNGQPGPGKTYRVIYNASDVRVTSAPPPPGVLFTPVDPVRILDSRSSSQVGPYSSPWSTQTVRDVQVTGLPAGVPADAEAVTLNVTATGTTASSHLRIWPKGDVLPTVSNVNWQAGWTIPNSVTVKIGTEGKISVYNNNGSANVIIDVVGYYRAASGSGFTSLEPVRIIDSRPSSKVGPFSTPWGTGTTREVVVTGGAVPANAGAVVLNVTATGTTASSNLRIWPTGLPLPTVSSLNWQAGWTIPNAVTVKVGTNGRISVYNNNGNAHVIIDVVGYFAAGNGEEFHPLTPARIQDSRPGSQVGPYGTPWGTQTTRSVGVTATGGVPTDAAAVLLNTTVTGTTASSNLRIWPGGPTVPLVSSLNWQPGWTIANAVTAKVGGSGGVNVYNNNGASHVIADVAGWYG